MYSRRDAYAAFLSVECIWPCARSRVSLRASRSGFGHCGEALATAICFLGGGLLAIFFAPILLAIVVVVFASGAIATGIAFFLIAPLFRVLESATSKAWLVVAGSLAGLRGGSVGFWPLSY